MARDLLTALTVPALAIFSAVAQETSRAILPPVPAPLGVPKPSLTNDAPYAPQSILPGGVVVTLYPPDSTLLKRERIREAEQYNLSKAVPGRISSIVNIHNPSIDSIRSSRT